MTQDTHTEAARKQVAWAIENADDDNMVDFFNDSDPEGTSRVVSVGEIRAAIEALPARTDERPNGDAGDALDFALGHLSLPESQVEFLEAWRSDDLAEYLGYHEWLATQRRCAAKAKASRTGEAR